MKEPTQKDLRQFGITLGIILAVFGGIHYLKDNTSIYPWFAVFAVLAVFLGAFTPRTLKPVYFVFLKIAHAIGWFNTRVILVLVYYVLLAPIGLVMGVFKNDPLNRKLEKDAETYWIKRHNLTAGKEDLEKQF